MTQQPPDSHEQDLPERDELFILFSIAANKLVGSSDPVSFLNWISAYGPVLAPGIADSIEGPPEPAFRIFGVGIYNAMPLPDQDFRRVPLARPGRNEPCYCGSGQKFKLCCAELGTPPDFSDYNMLRHILDSLPATVFKKLPHTRVDVEMLADTARQWREEGELNRAEKLLDPWFKGEGRLSGRLAPAFFELMEVYLDLGRPRKRSRLLNQSIERGEQDLRAEALQRKATILADQGDTEAAWKTFRMAQREKPGDLSLSILELTLLVTQGEIEQAKSRATFWLNHARRDRQVDPDFISLLEDASRDPVGVFADIGRSSDPDLDQLVSLLAEAPPVQSRYRIETSEVGGILTADTQMAALEDTWRSVFPECKPGLTSTRHGNPAVWDYASGWLDLLAGEPQFWHSFEVVDDLAMAAAELPIVGIEEMLLEPLLQRGEALLEANLGAAGEQDETIGELPWLVPENRCALRLLAHYAYMSLSGEDAAGRATFVRIGERLLQLNPTDNHGIRFDLSRCYLEAGEHEQVVALAEQFPDDLCILTLNHILALYRLGREKDALQALRAAADAGFHDEAVNMLLAGNPKKPKLSAYGITTGGRDEAWFYRQEHLHLWQQDDALDWLGRAWRSVPRNRRR